jgi:hypothetical protein
MNKDWSVGVNVRLATAALGILISSCSASIAMADDAPRCRLGILRILPNGDHEMDVETRQIPLRMLESGFRWGVTFENPSGKEISWYEIVHLPARLKEMSGDLSAVSINEVKTEINHSHERHIVDQFWFDEGDPMGKHVLDLYINDRKKCTLTFEVVPASPVFLK